MYRGINAGEMTDAKPLKTPHPTIQQVKPIRLGLQDRHTPANRHSPADRNTAAGRNTAADKNIAGDVCGSCSIVQAVKCSTAFS